MPNTINSPRFKIARVLLGQRIRPGADGRRSAGLQCLICASHREAAAGSRLLSQSADGIFASRADVAQLVEQRFRKPQVTGSNPVVGSSLRLERSVERKLEPRRSKT